MIVGTWHSSGFHLVNYAYNKTCESELMFMWISCDWVLERGLNVTDHLRVAGSNTRLTCFRFEMLEAVSYCIED